MKQKNCRCLLLNVDFTPLSIIPWKRAVIWHIKYANNASYGIDIIDFYKNDCIVGTNNRKYPVPAVARINSYIKLFKKDIKFSRQNLFLRDNYTCQYCGVIFDHKNLTYDHIIPKSIWDYDSGSPTVWTNITTACIKCNHKKGNKTPAQAKMPLLNMPYKPTKNTKYLPVVRHLLTIKDTIPDEWMPYLPKSYTNT